LSITHIPLSDPASRSLAPFLVMDPKTVLLPVLAAALAFSSPAAEPAAKPALEAKPTAPVLTGAAALIARHVKALGGEEALRAQTVRSLKGDLELAVMPGVTVNFVSLAKAPDKLLQAIDIPNGGTIVVGTDGPAAWVSMPGGNVQDITGDQLKDLVRQADFWRPIEPGRGLGKLAVKGTEKVGEVPCDVVEGITADGKTEKLFFASATGLLVRWDHEAYTDAGMQPAQDIYEDYKEIGGIKVAYRLRRTKPDTATFTLRVTDVGTGGNPEDSKFKKPTQ